MAYLCCAPKKKSEAHGKKGILPPSSPLSLRAHLEKNMQPVADKKKKDKGDAIVGKKKKEVCKGKMYASCCG